MVLSGRRGGSLSGRWTLVKIERRREWSLNKNGNRIGAGVGVGLEVGLWSIKASSHRIRRGSGGAGVAVAASFADALNAAVEPDAKA